MFPLALALAVSSLVFTASDGGADGGWTVDDPPVAGARDISIDVTEGTWMNVDVSPRGDRIAFDLLGDLYLLPIAGGEAVELTRGVAWDMQPRFTPDGREIVFTSDRGGGDNIWTVPLDGGAPSAVTKETFRLLNSPAISPDGRFVVARKHFTSRRSIGAGELWMYGRGATGEGVQLTEKQTEQKDLGEPAFSPDGRYVYFSHDVTPGKVFLYDKDPNGEIYAISRLDLDRKELSRFVGGPGGSVRPTPSPDGKSLAFVRRVRGVSWLYLADVKSGAERPLFEGLDRDMQETWAIHGVSPAMAWLPDSSAIVFWAKGGLHRIDVATRKVSAIPFHVKATRRVFPTVRSPQVAEPPQVNTHASRGVAVAPGGGQVAYEAFGKIWIRPLPTGTPRRLTAQLTHRELMPSYSADGASIVYATWDDEQQGSIRLAPAGGGEGKPLTSAPGHYVEPVLSPDGKVVVYRAAAPSLLRSPLYAREPGLYVLPLGGSPRRIATDAERPHFSAARADRVFFLTVNQDGKDDVRSLKSIRLDGSEELTHLTSDEATEYQVSPDGKWVAFKENFNAYLMPFPRGARAAVASPDSKAFPVARLSKDAGSSLQWSKDSRRLLWAWGGQLFSRELADAFSFVAGKETLPEPVAVGITLGPALPPETIKGVVAFTGARVLTMKGEEIIEKGTVVIRDGRIAAVGPVGAVTVPAGARTFDVTGKTIMPGLIDTHWHGGLGADGILPEQSWVLLASLAFGVTTVHDPSHDTEEWFAAQELARTGGLTAPRLFSTGTILYGAQGAEYRAAVESLDDARSHLRRMQAAGAFSVKSYNQPRRDQRQKVLQAARELNMLVVPEGGSLLQHNLTMIVDGHTTIEHAIPVSRVYADVVQLWSQTGTAWNPTLVVAYGGLWGENYFYADGDVWADERLTSFVPRRLIDARSRRRTMFPKEEVNHVEVARIARLLSERGVNVQIGAHGQREGLGAHWELWSLALGGMPPLQVLRAGTINGAKAVGLDRDLGSLEVGKLGDLIVLDKDPLQDIRNSRTVSMTVVGGRVWSSATMDEVWPQARKRPPLYFELEGGQAWPVGVSASEASDLE